VFLARTPLLNPPKDPSPPPQPRKKATDVSIVGATKVQIRINKPIYINR
jgi:hypothetical protein